MTTLDLFSTIGVVVVPDHAPEATIQERFEAFAAANPWVGEALEGMALELHHRGRKRIGVKMLAERLRYEYERATHDPTSTFRINNSYVSRYARWLVERHPELADSIELRELKA